MPWPIFTDQIHLDAEKDAANAFLKIKNLPLIESLKFLDDDTESYISVNNGQYYINCRSEPYECRNIKGTYTKYMDYLYAVYVDEPSDPEEPGGEILICEDSNFGSLSYFLVRVALETVFMEWRNFHRG